MQVILNCPYRQGQNCKWLSNNLGKLVLVPELFCNHTCKKTGPYCGQEINDEKKKIFLGEAFINTYLFMPLHSKFLHKVINGYKREASIFIPPDWKSISKNLEFLYKDFPFVKNILLTGSVIVEESSLPHKDYDILLIVDDWDYVTKDFISKLPEKINGIKCDYFFSNEVGKYMFFVSLDCINKKLYTVKWFDLKVKKIPADIEIIHENTNNSSIADYIEKVLEQRFSVKI